MCLDDQILSTYLDNELTQPWKSQVEEHLKHCQVCQKRYESIQNLRKILKNTQISEMEIKARQDRVLAVLEKNHLNKKKTGSVLKKTIKLSVSQFIGVAAAFVVVFVGSWTAIGSSKDKAIPLPEINPAVIDISNITPVRAIEKTNQKTLDSYSLEDILQNLDSRGYEVDVRLKGLHPIEEPQVDTTIEEQTN